MTSALLPCRTAPAYRQGHTGFSGHCLRPCTANNTRLEVRVAGLKLWNAGGASASSRQSIVAIEPTVPAASTEAARGGPSFPAIGLAVVGVAGLVAMVFKKLKNNGLDDNTARYSVNMYLANVMKDVNTVRIEDLSSDQIEAARARRSKERANHRLSLEEIELPQNHPFATKQTLSKEEYEQTLQNLRARSMRRRNFDAMQNGGDGARAGPGARQR